MPTIGCHSVIESPECVSRVAPPTTISANTSAQHASSQTATARGWPRLAALDGDKVEATGKLPDVGEVMSTILLSAIALE